MALNRTDYGNSFFSFFYNFMALSLFMQGKIKIMKKRESIFVRLPFTDRFIKLLSCNMYPPFTGMSPDRIRSIVRKSSNGIVGVRRIGGSSIKTIEFDTYTVYKLTGVDFFGVFEDSVI